MASKPGNRRRRIIVDAPAQKRMVVRSTALPLAVVAIGAIAMLEMSGRAFEQAEDIGAAAPSYGLLVAVTIVFILGVSVAAIWLALRQSHRVAGPAYRLQKSIQRIRQGDLDFEVTVRDGDELTDLADELNLLLTQLRERAPAGAVAGAVDATQAPGESAEQRDTVTQA